MWWPLLAAPAFVAHGLMRALQLRQRGPLAYAALTVAPACALLVAVLVMSALHTPHWGLALCVSAFFSAAWAWAMRLREAPPGCAQTPPPRGLWQTNTHAFAQNMSAAAQPALMLSLLPALGATPRAVGELAMSMLFLQVMAAGANFAAPAAYDRVARGQRLWPAGKGASLAGLAVLATLVALWLTPWCLNLLLPAQEWASPALTSSTRWAVLAGVLTFTARLVGTVLQAHGRFAALSVQAGLRLGLSLGLTWVLARMSVPLPVAGALAWAITEALITAHGVACLRGPVTSATR